MNIINKKGQGIAIFAIVAIVITITLIIFFVLRNRVDEGNIGSQEIGEVKRAQQAQRVYELVQSCLEKYSAEGANILGVRGGYIYFPDDAERATFPNKENKTMYFSGDTLIVKEGNGKNQIPYWVTDKGINIPSKEYMEGQLALYLEDSIVKCVENFSTFKSEGLEVSSGPISADVGMGSFVNIKVRWPLTIKYNNETYTLDENHYQLPINFALIHNIAFKLAVYELQYNYLENHANSLISLYSYGGGEKSTISLPPTSFTDTNSDCNSVSWTKPEVKSELAAVFRKNYPNLKMGGTNFTQPISTSSEAKGVYDSFVYNYFENLSNINIDFSYLPEWGMEFDIKPSLGDSVLPDRTSKTGIPFLPQFCTFKYAFKYSAVAPILIRIKDTKSSQISGGFEFYFPMKMYLCGNQNRQCTGINPYAENVDLNKIFKEDVTSRIYDCTSVDEERDITIKDENGNLLSSVDITQKCSGFVNECFLGRTNSNGVVHVKIPKCTDQKIKLVKLGFSQNEQDLKDEFILYSIKEYNIGVELIKASIFAQNYYLTDGFTHASCDGRSAEEMLAETKVSFRDKDQAIIQISGDYLETPLVTYPTQSKIKLSSGNYNIASSYTGKVVIRPSTYSADDKDVTVSFGVVNTMSYSGMWPLANNNINWKLQGEDIKGGNVVFKIMTSYISSDDLEVKSFDDPVLKADGTIKITADVDKECNSSNSNGGGSGVHSANIEISPSEYSKFVTPEFK
jgi:hypothetical protein